MITGIAFYLTTGRINRSELSEFSSNAYAFFSTVAYILAAAQDVMLIVFLRSLFIN